MNVILKWRMNSRSSCVKKFLEGVVVVTLFSVLRCLFLCQELSISMMKTTLQPSSNQSSLDAPLLSFRFPNSTHESYPGPHYYRSPTVCPPTTPRTAPRKYSAMSQQFLSQILKFENDFVEPLVSTLLQVQSDSNEPCCICLQSIGKLVSLLLRKLRSRSSPVSRRVAEATYYILLVSLKTEEIY